MDLNALLTKREALAKQLEDRQKVADDLADLDGKIAEIKAILEQETEEEIAQKEAEARAALEAELAETRAQLEGLIEPINQAVLDLYCRLEQYQNLNKKYQSLFWKLNGKADQNTTFDFDLKILPVAIGSRLMTAARWEIWPQGKIDPLAQKLRRRGS